MIELYFDILNNGHKIKYIPVVGEVWFDWNDIVLHFSLSESEKDIAKEYLTFEYVNSNICVSSKNLRKYLLKIFRIRENLVIKMVTKITNPIR